ncbi:MAG: PD-(D/E)XK nuclease family protein [Methanomassiliicoccales archaeon]
MVVALIFLIAVILFLVYLVVKRRITYIGFRPENTGILLSRRFAVAGKPDMVLRRGGGFVPVEMKSAEVNGNPREWDVAQLLTYCLIVEETMGFVPYGMLIYPNVTFTIPWDAARREYVVDLINEVRTGPYVRTNERWKCAHCPFRQVCLS